MRRSLLAFGLVLPLMVFSAACATGPAPSGNCDYVSIAKVEIAKVFPWFVEKEPIAMRNDGRLVVVYYPVPDGLLGGGPTVEIYRRSCKVKRTYYTQ